MKLLIVILALALATSCTKHVEPIVTPPVTAYITSVSARVVNLPGGEQALYIDYTVAKPIHSLHITRDDGIDMYTGVEVMPGSYTKMDAHYKHQAVYTFFVNNTEANKFTAP